MSVRSSALTGLRAHWDRPVSFLRSVASMRSTLPAETWALRHRWVMRILAVQVALVPLFALLMGAPLLHALFEALLPGAFLALAAVPALGRTARASLATIGLMTVSMVVVHLSHGAIEAHFHFFVMVPIVGLYESWVAFFMAIGYVLFQHGIMGSLDPHSMYNHQGGQVHPWWWAGIHAVAFGLAWAGSIVNWRLQEQARSVERSLTTTLAHQAHHDVLTGLPNRAALARHLEGMRGRQHALLFFDLDRFKEVNDTLGHGCGDELLVEVARRLEEHTRPGDLSMRLGGDEFAVVLTGATAEEGVKAAERLQFVLAAPIVVQGIVLTTEASIGIAASDGRAEDFQEQLMRQADIAMYAAKRAGRGPQAWNEGLKAADATQLALLGELKGAISDGQIELHYQPKVRVADGALVGVEGLVRWNHPEHGLLAPGRFLPAVESTGLIHPLTEFVVDEGVRQAAAWRAEGREVSVAVNLSARSLGDHGIVDTVRVALERHALPAHLLELELTESALQEDPERAREVLVALTGLGVHISLDDFGAGYTSVSQLEVLPISTIKVDRSLVHMAQSQQSLVLASLVKLGHDLGLTVVAEGVEDAETVDLLDSRECDVMQGYHVARPMPAAALDAWLRADAAARVESGS